MKKLLLLILLFGCEPKVVITTGNNFNTAVSGFIKASIIQDFEHQYDSVSLTVTNNVNSKQYFYSGPSPSMTISLSVGNYNMYMSTPDPDSISYYMAFTASEPSVDISNGTNNIILSASSKQALILMDSASVDGVPTIQAGNQIGLMSSYGKYYYSYVLGTCLVSYSINGQVAEMPIFAIPEKIYIFSASIGNLNIDDPFTEVIQI
jgi:hypothetical protein